MKAFHDGLAWLYDQPFSIQPANFTCFLATTALDMYKEALDIIELSERTNPNNIMLAYHKIFALASLNRVEEAQKALDSISKRESTTRHEVICLADQGLILYRRGQRLLGREFYRKALEKAEGNEYEALRALAAIYYAREEIIAHSPDVGVVRELAHEESRDIVNIDVQIALEHLRRIEEKYEENSQTAQTSQSSTVGIHEKIRT
jgi:tetratricopeptide (TPR) repeat protein